MNSLGNSSKWPSYDSIPSTSSFLLSESEQTEDEADVFSEGEGDSGIPKSMSADEGIALSPNYLGFPARSDQQHSRPRRDRPERRPDESACAGSARSPEAATLGSSSATPGDLAFAQKCADLQMFTHPLLQLLHGLKTGRFDKGLTSFQQSVAIDRLQRILGILQKPDMGERYLHNLLQIEMMLKSWFPQMAFQSADTQRQTSTPRPHWHQNQLHMPVKKRKLSWSDPDQSGQVPVNHKQHQHGQRGNSQAAAAPDTASTRLPGSTTKRKAPLEETAGPALDSCTTEREFTHGAGTLRGSSHLCSKGENRRQLEASLPWARGSPAAQECIVSSSDSITTTDSP